MQFSLRWGLHINETYLISSIISDEFWHLSEAPSMNMSVIGITAAISSDVHEVMVEVKHWAVAFRLLW